jgi:import inner membrane translocase subunit TIM23
MAGKLRRTQITNYTLKSASSASNALGSVVVSYSLFHALISLADDDHSYLTDEAKSCISGTLTGVLFKSTSGLPKCAKGGLLGLGLASIWAFGLKKQDTVQNYI